MQPKEVATYQFQFLGLPGDDLLKKSPTLYTEQMEEQCHRLSKMSQAGRLGPILKVEHGLIIGELVGFVELRPDSDIVPVPGTLKPA